MNTKQTILVVDDEPEVLRLLEFELQYEGYVVIKASNGQEAIRKADLFIPDLVVLDILMPHMNGGQVLHELKLNPRTQNIPVVFLTAVLTKEDERIRHLKVAIDENFYPAIAKPFEGKDFLNEINRQLSKIVKGG